MNAHVHPVFTGALSAISGDALRAANRPDLRRYMVRIKKAGQTVRRFEAMAEDSCACAIQHAGLCGEGEKLEVIALEDWYAQIDREMLADKLADGYEQRQVAGGVEAERQRGEWK